MSPTPISRNTFLLHQRISEVIALATSLCVELGLHVRGVAPFLHCSDDQSNEEAVTALGP